MQFNAYICHYFRSSSARNEKIAYPVAVFFFPADAFEGELRKCQNCLAGKETPKTSEEMRQERGGLNKADGCTLPPHFEKIIRQGRGMRAVFSTSTKTKPTCMYQSQLLVLAPCQFYIFQIFLSLLFSFFNGFSSRKSECLSFKKQRE